MVLKRLREETREHHERVERCFDLGKRLGNVESYRVLLEKLLVIYGGMEAALEGLDWKSAGIDFEARRKVGWLEKDLTALGVGRERMAEIRRGAGVKAVQDLAEGFGWLYVLEGATLGGQVICPMVRERLGLETEAGGQFFASYGKDVGKIWKQFCGAISARCVKEKDVDEAVAGAVKVFLYFETQLGN